MKDTIQIEEPRIVAIGDSHVYGRVDHLGGWTAHIRARLESEKPTSAVFNLGIGGENSEGLLGRLEAEVTTRSPNIVMIGVGTNDSRFGPMGGQASEVPISSYKRNVSDCIELVRKHEALPILLSIPRINADGAISFNEDYYNNHVLQLYVEAQLEISRYTDTLYADIWAYSKDFESGDYADLVHLNSDGHKKYADFVSSFMSSELGI